MSRTQKRKALLMARLLLFVLGVLDPRRRPAVGSPAAPHRPGGGQAAPGPAMPWLAVPVSAVPAAAAPGAAGPVAAGRGSGTAWPQGAVPNSRHRMVWMTVHRWRRTTACPDHLPYKYFNIIT